MKKITRKIAAGFSLIEIAIVLIIISVLLAIVAVPLATQIEQRRITDTNKQLEVIQEAIIGYVLANGRLPCPSRAIDNGAESVVSATTGDCNTYAGFVPAVTLGISPVDASGFAVDAWGLTANRIRYAVRDLNITAGTPSSCTSSVSHVLTKTDGMKAASMGCLSDVAPSVNMLTVCAVKPTGAAGAATGCTAPLTTKAPFVLLSLGKNAPTGGTGADEAHNVDGDNYFVSHPPTNASSAAQEFDDLLTWPSLNTIFARMVQVGRLP